MPELVGIDHFIGKVERHLVPASSDGQLAEFCGVVPNELNASSSRNALPNLFDDSIDGMYYIHELSLST
ncbi:hypothetical protein GCM10017709_34320 [Glutamicibacter nicotianae]|uniref:Uncharacterized protein n=1 Tax=Glutamicibacter nicotianae TaxID=37929 RepID=A0ABQ0RHB1_GLUNI|nr:hypothetical protein ANI01nite_04120 [Glutamicibacter nicotianae]